MKLPIVRRACAHGMWLSILCLIPQASVAYSAIKTAPEKIKPTKMPMTDGLRETVVDGVNVRECYDGDRLVKRVPSSGYDRLKLTAHDHGKAGGPLIGTRLTPHFSWQLRCDTDALFIDISFGDAQVGYAAAELGIVYTTDDGGRQWTKILDMGFPYYWYGVYAFNAHEVVISGFDNRAGTGILRWSDDGGVTWGNVVTVSQNDWLDTIEFADRDHGIAPVYGGVYYTTNGGAAASDWTYAQANPGGWFGGNFTFLPDLNAWITGIYFCHSADGGASWSHRRSIDWTFDSGVHFLNHDIGATGGGIISPLVAGWVHVTTDGGRHWSSQTLRAPYPVRALMYIDRELIFAVGGDGSVGGIYSSLDGGVTWNLEIDAGIEMRSLEWKRVDPDHVDVWVAGGTFDGRSRGRIYSSRIFRPPLPTITPSQTPQSTPSPTATPTRTPTITPSPSPMRSPTMTPSPAPSSSPRIMAAGYGELPGPTGGPLTLLAYVHDEDGLADIDNVEVLHGGSPTGLDMKDDGTQGDFAAGDGVYGLSIDLGPVGTPIKEVLEIRATDRIGNESSPWPYLTVTDGTTAHKTLNTLTRMSLSRNRFGNAGPPDSISSHRSQPDMEGPRPREPFLNDSPYRSTSQNRPEIKLAGYMNTEITTATGGWFIMLAYVEDPDGIGDIATVEIHYQGIGAGVFLEDDGLHGDGAAGDGVYGFTAAVGPGVPSGRYLFELVATDHAGNCSLLWPYLVIDGNNTITVDGYSGGEAVLPVTEKPIESSTLPTTIPWGIWPLFCHDEQNTGRSPYAGPVTGRFLWSYSTGFRYPTGPRIHSSPVIGYDGNVYVGAYDNRIYACSSRGSLQWSYETTAHIYASPAVNSDGSIFVNSCDNILYALYSSGMFSWSYVFAPNNSLSSPTIDLDRRLFMGAFDNRICAFSSIGSLSWSYATGQGGIVASPALGFHHDVYVASRDNTMYAITSTGTLLWSYRVYYPDSSPAIGLDNKVYMGCRYNNLLVLFQT